MPLSYPLARRRFLAMAGAASLGFCGPLLVAADSPPVRVRAAPAARLPGEVFQLGVASGDPLPDGVMLWTRLAPRPLDGGGMPARPVPVLWEVSTDQWFRQIVRSGISVAKPATGHSLHVDVRGLRAGWEYFYRFRTGNQASPVGRTRTAPAPDARPAALRFATASCQNWQDGYYTAYRAMAEEDLDFVAFLGDYIYEAAPRPDAPRQHTGPGQPYTLVDYRNRHAQYRTDPDLAAAHAAAPWVVTMDDHDVDDNWTGDFPANLRQDTMKSFHARKVAAFQAFYEHMPLRTSPPADGSMRLYRRLRFGDLATLHVLDTRQYRSDHPATAAAANEPHRTMTGPAQERWLVDGLRRSGSRWNLLANQVMWAASDRQLGQGRRYSFDSWDAYRAQRQRLLELFGSGATRNPVVLTGDQHATWISDLKLDFDAEKSPVVGAEITGTSITSGGDADLAAFHRDHDPLRADNPHWKFIDNRRGYVLCEVRPDRMHAALRVVDSVRHQDAGATRTAARFVLESDRPGIELNGRPTPPPQPLGPPSVAAPGQ